MEKKQIDYQQFERERIISISDLIEEILRKLWLVILFAVIFAVLFGGYKYSKDISAAKVAVAIQTDDLEASVSDEEMQQVKQVERLTDDLEDKEAYVDASILMKINPYMENRTTLQMAVQAQEADVSGIMDALNTYVTEGALAMDLNEQYPDVEAGYLGELISFEGGSTEIKVGSTGTASFATSGNVFTVIVMQTDEDACDELADNVAECLYTYAAETEDALGAYELVLVDRSVTTSIDTDLLSYQNTQNDALESLRSTLSDKKSALTDSQLRILNQDAEDSEDADGSEQTSVGISKKYVAVGAMIGIILGIVVIILRYLIRGTLNLNLEFQSMFNMSVFGQVSMFEKNNIFVAVWRRILNRRRHASVADEQQLVLTNLLAYCKQNEIARLLFVSSRSNLHEIAWLGQMAESLKQAGIQSEQAEGFPYSASAVNQMQDCEAVVFVETLHVSRYEDVLNGVKKCLEQGRQIGGAIALS